MSKNRNKRTIDEIPQPIKIKKEKLEEDRSLYSMAHYVDDRLEMIKQIFSTLKPKTITNLAPDFLKEESIDKVEELCLAEILCMSRKRLLSVINATRCPTDTESSSDEDVETKEEHVSLEEISSGSEIDEKGKKRKVRKSTNMSNGATSNGVNGKSTAKGESKGEITVLELLELQARARAIRSQLALEPITKIELTSEDEKPFRSATSKQKTEVNKVGKPKDTNKANEGTSSSIKSISNGATTTSTQNNLEKSNSNDEPKSVTIRKPIKLKRNYRTSDKQYNDDANEVNDPSNGTENVNINEIKSRSASPDIIPIVPEPETLLINDSSDEEPMPVSVDDKSDNKKKDITKVPKEKGEPEEGEISDTDDEDIKETVNVDDANKTEDTQEQIGQNEVVDDNDEKKIEESKETTTNNEEAITELKKNELVEEITENTDTIIAEKVMNNIANIDEQSVTDNSNSIAQGDEEDIDDVISIEGGYLENEMIEHLVEESCSSSASASVSACGSKTIKIDDNITASNDKPSVISISIDSSNENSNADEDVDDDDDDKSSSKDSTQLWKMRYLQSAKMSKLLTQSRLGKRVRDRIKSNNKAKNSKGNAMDVNAENSQDSQKFQSKHEDGSIEQYNELRELQNREM